MQFLMNELLLLTDELKAQPPPPQPLPLHRKSLVPFLSTVHR